jgi:hypothetical protein
MLQPGMSVSSCAVPVAVHFTGITTVAELTSPTAIEPSLERLRATPIV